MLWVGRVFKDHLVPLPAFACETPCAVTVPGCGSAQRNRGAEAHNEW